VKGIGPLLIGHIRHCGHGVLGQKRGVVIQAARLAFDFFRQNNYPFLLSKNTGTVLSLLSEYAERKKGFVKKRRLLNLSRQRFFRKTKLFRLEGAALGAALGGYVAAAAPDTDALRFALAVFIVSAVFRAALDGAFHRGGLSAGGGVFPVALMALFIGVAAGLAAVPGGRAVHLDPGQAALIVTIVLAGSDLTFQSVHKKAPQF